MAVHVCHKEKKRKKREGESERDLSTTFYDVDLVSLTNASDGFRLVALWYEYVIHATISRVALVSETGDLKCLIFFILFVPQGPRIVSPTMIVQMLLHKMEGALHSLLQRCHSSS